MARKPSGPRHFLRNLLPIILTMAFAGLLVNEIFHSIQGESSQIGLPFVFIRLSGCNLRCTYCDTTYAFKGGIKMTIQEILNSIQTIGTRRILITGGEPLLQRNTATLVKELVMARELYKVSIETSGEYPIGAVAAHAKIIMDIKTPSSGMCRGGFIRNLPFLKESDEIKFVIASQADYFWAKNIIETSNLPTKEILFSPATQVSKPTNTTPNISARWLANRILEDRLNVRLQIQLHKIIWGPDRRGV